VLSKAQNPEDMYIGKIMPEKIELNLKYIAESSFLTDLKIIIKTIAVIFT